LKKNASAANTVFFQDEHLITTSDGMCRSLPYFAAKLAATGSRSQPLAGTRSHAQPREAIDSRPQPLAAN